MSLCLEAERNSYLEVNYNPVCVCCLSQNIYFVQLEKCKHRQFISETFKIHFNGQHTVVVCMYCHRMLVKFYNFKLQVQRSIFSLSHTHIKKTPESNPVFKISPTETWSVLPKDDLIQADPMPLKLLDEIKPLLKQDNKKTETFIEIREIKEEIKFDNSNEVPPRDDNVAEVKTEYDDPKNSNNNSDTAAEKELDDFVKNTQSYANTTHVHTDDLKCIARIVQNTQAHANATAINILPYSRNIVKNKEAYTNTKNGRIREITLTKEQFLAEREIIKKDPGYISRKYKCEYCVQSFVYLKPYQDHMKKHEVKRGLPFCQICNSYHKKLVDLKSHFKKHFSRYDCTVCKKRFTTERSCASHYNIVHGSTHGILSDYTFECDECDFFALSDKIMQRHRQKMHKPPIRCKLCIKKFTNSTSYSIHMINVHREGDANVYNCKVCDKKYTKKGSLNMHIRNKHPKDETPSAYICTECKKVYNSKQTFKAHLRIHSKNNKDDNKRFECDYCGAKCRSKWDMTLHIYKLHMRINKCHICTKVLNSPTYLKKHIKQVHEKKLPRDKICQYCGKAFTETQILKAHIRRHTGERPFACPYCPATFAHSGARYTHNKLVHNPNRVQPARKQNFKSSKTGKTED